MLTAREAAHRIGHSEGWFRQHYRELRAAGFPEMDPLLERWDAQAIDRWLDSRGQRKPSNLQRAGLSLEAKLVQRAQQWPASS